MFAAFAFCAFASARSAGVTQAPIAILGVAPDITALAPSFGSLDSDGECERNRDYAGSNFQQPFRPRADIKYLEDKRHTVLFQES
ncbi:MAG: hypothetical protein ABWY07_12250 [Burkholderiales bacterium]